MSHPTPHSPEKTGWLSCDPMVGAPWRVESRAQLTADCFELVLKAEDERSFPFAPGQFNMLYAFGAGEVAISISGDPEQPQRLVHTIRAVGATTRALGRLTPGDCLLVRGPFGKGWPLHLPVGSDVLIVTGGIGLPPLRPFIYHALRNIDRYSSLSIAYGARTPSDLLFLPELEAWAEHPRVNVRITVDRGDPGWSGTTGVVTKLLDLLSFEPPNTFALSCGPEIMMRLVARDLQQRGVSADHIYLSAERSMKCGIGFCGHCQLGPLLLCQEGPVVPYPVLEPLLTVRSL